MVKYPTDALSYSKSDPDIKKHKLGYYAAEQHEFLHISENIGTYDGSGQMHRHPLTFLLEAADDIAYATADLEDAFKKRLFSLDSFIEFFENSYNPEDAVTYGNPAYYSNILIQELCDLRGEEHTPEGDSQAFGTWLDHTRRWLMYVAVYSFSYNYREIMNGTYNEDLFVGTNHSITIKTIKNAMGRFAFDAPNILKLELSAQTILSFLLDKFVHAVLYSDYQDEENGFMPSKADKKYLSIFPDNYKRDYKNMRIGDDEGYDLYLRLLIEWD